MASKRIETVTLNELRRKPLDVLKQVQYSGEPRLVTHFRQIVGKLVPPKDNDIPKKVA